MQEEMNEKTVSLIIRGTKVTAVVLKDAMKMFLRQTSNRGSNGRDGKGTSEKQKQVSQTGKISLRKMMKEGSELSNIEISDENIKSFEKIARKYS
ncbi:MAG: PcfB family protein, partial [Lachnospiraceae bacterium]|nr:PcfB family protein [Lachnospiraceae bacterium]